MAKLTAQQKLLSEGLKARIIAIYHEHQGRWISLNSRSITQ